MLIVGSLFSGIGGLELGLEDTGGFQTAWQVECDRQAQEILARHWPEAGRWDDVREFPPLPWERWQCDVLCGGDPCPAHGNARRGQPSAHPDLSGYFLAVAERLRPRWVVRENVPAPTARDFAAGLEWLGYGTLAVRLDARHFTAQARKRDFVIGRLDTHWSLLAELLPVGWDGAGPHQTRLGLGAVAACLTTNRTRHNTDENYVFERGRLRILEGRERARLAGFPEDWCAGLSEHAQARLYGNAVVPGCARWIGERILKFEKGRISAR